ncbi:MAG: hypothetical protein LQ342_007842 [Letrouitia transgressa]|nr:MAG: hypothetical protein LQ342_007842 [Letrouitia transgressa]
MTPLFAEIGDAQAKRLPNKTIPLPYTSRHLVGLDVFHQLHCLNTLRKRLRPERYDGKGDSGKTKDVATGMKHWDHCVESLRQSLLCSADLSAVSWHWSKEQGWRTGTNEHVCRKWENVMMWAEKHRRRHNQDGSLID